MLKKLFDWTPRDIAYWEKVHQAGLKRFIRWYGIFISGGLLFLVFGLVTVFIWLRQIIRHIDHPDEPDVPRWTASRRCAGVPAGWDH